ncbi:hypothetical protein [Advenella sp. FME57]|uniref:hypothetical protein n=1 Tax=Advenella sp. FME57 TaxID=2742604 RepID=UPI001868DE3E|nr:hypothetical protein [Advenella sp. FME57]
MDKAALQAFRSQIYSMEKALVTMRAYMDEHIQNAPFDADAQDFTGPVENALESLLTRFSPEVTEQAVQAYEEITRGVCVGFSLDAGGFSCKVKTDTYHDESDAEDPTAGSSCLLIYPSIDPEHDLTYFTLETDVSIDALREINNLTLDFVPAFSASSDELVEDFSMYLRLYFPDSRHEDYHHKSYPALGIPLAFSYHIDDAQYESLPLAEAIGARIIINLPRATSDLNRILLSSFMMTGARV